MDSKVPLPYLLEDLRSAAARAEQFFSRKICVLSEVQDEQAPQEDEEEISSVAT